MSTSNKQDVNSNMELEERVGGNENLWHEVAEGRRSSVRQGA